MRPIINNENPKVFKVFFCVSQEVATGTLIDIFDSAPVSSNAVPTETNPAVERELFELKKQFAELKTLSANLELQLQSKEKEIANLTQGVKDKTAELAEIKTSLAQNEKGKTKLADELTQTTSQLDKVSSDKETLGKTSVQCYCIYLWYKLIRCMSRTLLLKH